MVIENFCNQYDIIIYMHSYICYGFNTNRLLQLTQRQITDKWGTHVKYNINTCICIAFRYLSVYIPGTFLSFVYKLCYIYLCILGNPVVCLTCGSSERTWGPCVRWSVGSSTVGQSEPAYRWPPPGVHPARRAQVQYLSPNNKSTE